MKTKNLIIRGKLFIILLLTMSVSCYSQRNLRSNFEPRSLKLTFVPYVNAVGLQFNHVVFEKFDYQIAADYNFSDFYRSSIAIGHTVLYDYFFINLGIAYSTLNNKHRFTPEITMFDREIFAVSIAVDLKIGYVRVGIGCKF